MAPVHIVFALAESGDERKFQLQALMAIAETVRNPCLLTRRVRKDM